MTQKFEDLMSKYIQDQSGILKRYVLAAQDSQDQYLCYLDMSLGTPLPSLDIKNCELLTDARLFREETKITRDGRNRYKLFYLTDLGKEVAQQIREDSSVDEMPESPKIAASAAQQTKLPT